MLAPSVITIAKRVESGSSTSLKCPSLRVASKVCGDLPAENEFSLETDRVASQPAIHTLVDAPSASILKRQRACGMTAIAWSRSFAFRKRVGKACARPIRSSPSSPPNDYELTRRSVYELEPPRRTCSSSSFNACRPVGDASTAIVPSDLKPCGLHEIITSLMLAAKRRSPKIGTDSMPNRALARCRSVAAKQWASQKISRTTREPYHELRLPICRRTRRQLVSSRKGISSMHLFAGQDQRLRPPGLSTSSRQTTVAHYFCAADRLLPRRNGKAERALYSNARMNLTYNLDLGRI